MYQTNIEHLATLQRSAGRPRVRADRAHPHMVPAQPDDVGPPAGRCEPKLPEDIRSWIQIWSSCMGHAGDASRGCGVGGMIHVTHSICGVYVVADWTSGHQ